MRKSKGWPDKHIKGEDVSTNSSVCNFYYHSILELSQLFTTLSIILSSMDSMPISSLHLAAEFDDTEIVEFLLHWNIDPNSKESPNGRTPLQLAVQNDNYKVAKVLLKYGADVNVIANDHLTALYIAILKKSTAMVKLLLEFGAAVNVKDKMSGKTPLFLAVQLNCPLIVALLLKHGASVLSSTCSGVDVVTVAKMLKDQQMAMVLAQFARMEKKLERARIWEEKEKQKKLLREPLLKQVLKKNFLMFLRTTL